MAGMLQQRTTDGKDANYPKITNYYCIPLCLKRGLNANSKINLKDDYRLINANIHELFDRYNHLFFDNKLRGVRLKWDYSEKLNAGLCNQYDTICAISLSVQLLQYRSSKDLIETLLHEMIHAYLFIKNIHHKEKTHHGARFLSIMNVLNYICDECKLNVWVRHDYLSEVNANKSHRWQCDGMCNRIIFRPYCRPPGKHEKWWNTHRLQCGGTYHIVEINANKHRLTKEEWNKKKVLNKKEKEERRKVKKEERNKRIENDDESNQSIKRKWNKRDRNKKYKTLMQ